MHFLCMTAQRMDHMERQVHCGTLLLYYRISPNLVQLSVYDRVFSSTPPHPSIHHRTYCTTFTRVFTGAFKELPLIEAQGQIVLPEPLEKGLREAVSIILASVKERRTDFVEKMSRVKIQQTQGLERDKYQRCCEELGESMRANSQHFQSDQIYPLESHYTRSRGSRVSLQPFTRVHQLYMAVICQIDFKNEMFCLHFCLFLMSRKR